jgi:outer membrane protein assembly factor BamB/tetratricopeptide (TPR) repeat protein
MGRLLDNDEVEFLLHGTREAGSRPSDTAASEPARDETPREVTMRGDLDKINLSDIFQTLAMSKMEGLLRIRGQIESREVHFRDGHVRCLVPRRIETLRLGQRLVRAGALSADQLRSSLLEQRKSKRSLGEILTEQQLVSADDIEEVVHNQLQEDLFALFTWPQGTFEFYKGEVADPVIVDRLAAVPPFEVNGVLLEVARRSDEWQRVMTAVGSLDEIVLATCSPDEIPADADADTRALLEAADGRCSIRDLADLSLIGLFDCGILVRELLEDGWLRKLSSAEMLDAVEAIVEAGEPRRAAIAVRAVLARGEDHDLETTKRIGGLMARCGEQRRAADVLLQAARATPDPEESLELARSARSVDRLSPDVLAFLCGILRRDEDSDREELVGVLTDLTDALADRGEYEEARIVVDELEQVSADLQLCRPRRARILAKLGSTAEAVEALLGLVEVYKERGDRERTAATYEQILKIDYRRKDVARALKGLHANKLARRGKVAVTAAVVVAVGLAGLVQYRSWSAEQQLLETLTAVQDALRRDDLPTAQALTQQASTVFGDAEGVQALGEAIRRFEQARDQTATRKVGAIRERIKTEAREMFRTGRAAEALASVRELKELGVGENDLHATLRDAITPLRVELDALRQTLPATVPTAPTLSQSPLEQKVILDALEVSTATPSHAAVVALNELREDAALRDALGGKDHAALIATVDELAAVYARLRELRGAYSDRLDRRSVALELTPLFHEAREHEKQHRFQAALDAYRTLLRNHPEDDDLRAQFEERVERFSTILRFLEIVDEATADGDFATAQGQLRALKRQFPDLPFDAIARLPLRIRTTPSGARVLVDGRPVGTAPVLTSYRPADETRIRVELEGFQPEETVLTGDEVGAVRSLLARVPRWSARRDTTVDRAPTPDAAGHLYLVDRAGTIAKLRTRDGAVLWSHPTGDLSGLLTGVVEVDHDRVVCGSIDGPLRCLRTTDGSEIWTSADLPTESKPLRFGPALVVATDDARIVAVGTTDGVVQWSTILPGPVRSDLIAIDARHALAATGLGRAVCVDVRSGRLTWSAEIGHGVVAAPAIRGREAVIAAEDGEVTRIDLESGRVLWRARGFANLTLAPVILPDLVLIADGPELHVLDGRSGRRTRSIRMGADLRTPLSLVDDLVFLGDADGLVTALAADDLEPRFVLRAEGPALAPIVATPDGSLVGAFQDRTLRAYRPVTGR